MYEALFAQKQLACSQILLTDSHFLLESGRANLRGAISALLDLRIVPVINENDVTSIGGGVFSGSDHSFWDNDSMASLICRELKVELAIFLTDVEGLCRTPPSANTKPDVVHTFVPGLTANFKLGSVSKVGRGGMQAKVDAAVATLKHARGVVIASGFHHDTIARILGGEKIGTFFTDSEAPETPDQELLMEDNENYRLATEAKEMSRKIQTISSQQRGKIILSIAESLWERRAEIIEANQKDVSLAQTSHVAPSLQARLVITEPKLKTLVDGLTQIANLEEPIGQIVERLEMAETMTLEKSTVPIGVLLVIFESRPDVLPQVAALAIRSGNGLVLKGGKEAAASNKILHTIIGDAIESSTEGVISRGLVSLVDSRDAVANLLSLDKVINLVIPRGSGELVRYIQSNTKIPVLGHADGICHVFVDKDASFDKAISICVDSKTEYPAACNAMETLLIHKDWPQTHVEQLLLAFRQQKVELFAGPRAGPILEIAKAPSLHTEYGRLAMTVEFVDDVHGAIKHINAFSSSHTESIITENQETAAVFLEQVDSACVFHNASTRFADGYRFGFGAEVGISTSRIHARGPVGIDGLMTSKWTLISEDKAGSIVDDYTKGRKQYTHRKLE